MDKKEKLIVAGIFISVVLLIFTLNKLVLTGENVSTDSQQAQVEIVPLSQSQINKIASILLESEFINDIPKKNPIALQFYDFEDGQRIWRSGFLISENELLTQGVPTVYLSIHSKYIDEISNSNICDVIKKANSNGDLGFYSEHSTASLLIKYAGMLKHKSCLGL